MRTLEPNPPLSFVGALTIAFVVLKLTAHVDWSWWWVLSPSLINASLRLLALIGSKES